MHFKFDSIVSDCGEPVPPANGSVISNDITHATIGCNEGYHENTAGKSVVSCLASGLWEESFQCHIGWGLIILYFDLHQQFFKFDFKKDFSKSNLEDFSICSKYYPDNSSSDCGEVDVPFNVILETANFTHAKISCQAGFNLIGESFLWCQESGKWDQSSFCHIGNDLF